MLSVGWGDRRVFKKKSGKPGLDSASPLPAALVEPIEPSHRYRDPSSMSSVRGGVNTEPLLSKHSIHPTPASSGLTRQN